MKGLSQLLHHRSLTVAMVALVLAFYALAFLPEHAYRLHQQGAAFLTYAAIGAALGAIWCLFTLYVLLRDNRSGYPSFRCSLGYATMGACVLSGFAAYSHRGRRALEMRRANNWVQATPVGAFCSFLSQQPGAPDPER
jgi:hypothetical protein